MSDEPTERLTALEDLARVATKMLGAENPALLAAQWQRLLLGKLTELLLDDDSRLTGAELRQLLGMERPAPATPKKTDGKLPPEFAEIVRQIYGVNLQTDVRPARPDDNRKPTRLPSPEIPDA